MNFLSHDNVLRHKEYLKDLKLKYSVLLKSYPEISGLDLRGIFNSRLAKEEKHEGLELLSNILMHELFFKSFCDSFSPSSAVKESYGSEANFLYEIEKEALERDDCGFIIVFFDRKNRLDFSFCKGFSEILVNVTPILSVDLWEHAYFGDYGFDKKRYVRQALSFLNFNKINEFSQNILKKRT